LFYYRLIGLIVLFFVGQRNKRPYDVGSEDDLTVLYFTELNPVHLNTAEELKVYLATETNVQKIRVDGDIAKYLYWYEHFVSKACIIVGSEAPYCEALSNSLVAFACSSSDVSSRSENSIIGFMDLAIRMVEHLARRPRERNVSSKTSGRYKPDSYVPMGVKGAACVTVEEKPVWMYKEGVMGSDPDMENLKKVDFNNWKNLYGDCPFIICFSVIADPTIFKLRMGAIEFASKQNVELYSCDLKVPGARAKFAFKLFQMLPVLKAIIEGSKTALIPMIPMTRHSSNRSIVKNIQAIQCPTLGVVLVEKEWSFVGVVNLNTIMADFTRMSKVFDRIGDNNLHDRFGVMKRVLHEDLRFHTVGILTSVNGAVAVDPTSGTIGMKGFFAPYGVPFNPITIQQLLKVTLSVALIVQFLQELNIVHNDIRWSNICAVETPTPGKAVRMMLFDFDDAIALNNNELCPGLHHLSKEEHPLKSELNHGGEVDVWAVGMLIDQHTLSCTFPPLKQFGERIMTEFETITIAEVVETLEGYLQNV
jgi:hypothetical protein